MKKKTILIIVLTAINLKLLILINPIIPSFFGMIPIMQLLYIISLFVFPVWIIIPISVVTAPLAFLSKKERAFKKTWFNYTQNLFLPFSGFILLMCAILAFSKLVMDNDPFPLVEYNNVVGFEGNIDDLKTGSFSSDFSSIERHTDIQFETFESGETAEFEIKWISNNAYRLINHGDSKGMKDTLDILISNNTPDYYECYLRFGDYVDYQKIMKD